MRSARVTVIFMAGRAKPRSGDTRGCVAIVFMFVAGINFSLHFFAWRYVSIKHYFQDPEFRAYSYILLTLSSVVVFTLFYSRGFDDPGETLINGLFQAVSISTTTGFTTENFALWPAALPVLLIFASFIGGSAGSTAGGIKVIRWLLNTSKNSIACCTESLARGQSRHPHFCSAGSFGPAAFNRLEVVPFGQ